MISSLCYEMITNFCGKKKDIPKSNVDALIELSKGQSGKKIDLIYEMKAYTDQIWLYVGHDELKEVRDLNQKKLCIIEIQKQELELSQMVQKEFGSHKISFRIFKYENGMKIPDGLYTKWFDYDKISSSIRIRNRQAGDFFYCTDEKKQKCKDYFINEKISLLLRDEIPLIADENHILWIVGYRMSNYYKITNQTKMVLEIQEEEHG